MAKSRAIKKIKNFRRPENILKRLIIPINLNINFFARKI